MSDSTNTDGKVGSRTICPQCGAHNCCLVGDGYTETYLCMACHFDAGRYLQNTPRERAVENQGPCITGCRRRPNSSTPTGDAKP